MASDEREFAYRKLITAWDQRHPCRFWMLDILVNSLTTSFGISATDGGRVSQ